MGTPGHMAHPFDVEDIETGEDLVDYINDAVSQLAAGAIAGSVKWDGINTSFKLVTDEDGNKDFRMDRGTNHIDSVVGLTAADAYKKWPKGHGMPPAIEKLLTIFNKALPSIESELKTLGLWDDPTKYFNTEYIEGTSNVQDYGANILAIHGINQFYEKRAQPAAIRKGTSMDRPGAPRPLGSDGKPIKSGGIEIPYSYNALENLIRKVQPYAEEYNFQIFGDVPVEFNEDVELDLEKILEIPIEIQIEPGNIKIATLREWLHMVKHPKDKRVTKSDGKSVGALSKDIYMAVLRSATEEGVALSEYLKDPNDINDAINGGIFYHATRLLGQAVKEALTSQVGSLSGHEGVVLRGLGDSLIKFTGDFIVQGLQSTHGNHVSENLSRDFTVVISKNRKITKSIKDWLTEASEANHKFQRLPEMVYKDVLAGTPIVDIVVQENAERTIYNAVMGYVNGLQEEDEFEMDVIDDEFEFDDEQDDPVVDEDFPKTIAIVPGAFKPPHRGHADMVRRYATGDGVEKADKVYVIVSAPLGAQRTFRARVDGKLVDIPIGANNAIALWKKLFPEVANLPEVEFSIAPSDMRSPITVAYKYISDDSPLPLNDGDKVMLGASDKLDDKKDPDWCRWNSIDKEKHVKDGIELLCGEEYAVPALKKSDGEGFSASTMRDLISDLIEDPSNKETYSKLTEFIPADKFPALFGELGVPIPTELDETSGAAAAGGYSAPFLPPPSTLDRGPKKKKKKKKKPQKEYIDLSLIDEVMKLIIERGITQ
jgi:hypothetical protein